MKVGFTWVRIYFIQCVSFIQPSVLHHLVDRIGVSDIIQRILIQNDQVGKLSGLDTSEVTNLNRLYLVYTVVLIIWT